MAPGFTWPMESLAIVAPIIFIVLMIFFPLIGLAAGWKRAAFWGGGNLLMYFIGLLIWIFAAEAIVSPISGLITQLLQSIEGAGSIEITPELIISVAAPLWFILWMAASELFLLINYYAWYKRVVGLKKIKVKDKKTGKITKEYAKINKKAGTVGYKIGNRLGGVLLLGALTIPSSMAFTQTIYYLTTNSTTRATNELSENIFNGIEGLGQGAFKWANYYPTTGVDYNAIFSAMSLINKEVTYTDEEGEHTTDAMSFVEQVIGGDITGLMDDLDVFIESEGEGDIDNQDIAKSISTIAEDWNTLVDQCRDEVEAVFSSDNVVGAVNQIIGPIISQTQEGEGSTKGMIEITPETYESFFGEDGMFNKIVEAYNQETPQIPGIAEGQEPAIIETKFETINVPESTLDIVVDLFYDFCDTSSLSEDDQPGFEQQIQESLKDILQILFTPIPKQE